MAKINLTEILMSTGGAVAGGVAGGMLKKLPVSSVVSNGAGVLVGAVLPMLAPKSALIKSVAAGVAAVAGRNLVAGFVPAIGEEEEYVGDDFDSSVGDDFDSSVGAVYYENPDVMDTNVSGIGEEDYDD